MKLYKDMPEHTTTLKPEEIDRVVEMAWEDRTPFDVIKSQFGLSEQQTIAVMREEMKPSSFRMWRKRVHGRVTKHLKLSDIHDFRFKSSSQKAISANKISKRT